MTMAVVTALQCFQFHTLLFSKDVQNLFSDGCRDECDDGTCDCFYRADHTVAKCFDYMVRFFILEKRSPDLDLSYRYSGKENTRLYFTEFAIVGMGLGPAFSADPSVHFLQHGAARTNSWNGTRNCILMTELQLYYYIICGAVS